MDISASVDLGKLTAPEAAQLSRLLAETWGIDPAATDDDLSNGDLIADFIVPLLSRAGATLSSPADHLADVRRRLHGKAAA